MTYTPKAPIADKEVVTAGVDIRLASLTSVVVVRMAVWLDAQVKWAHSKRPHYNQDCPDLTNLEEVGYTTGQFRADGSPV